MRGRFRSIVGGTLIQERVVRIDAGPNLGATIKQMTPTKLTAFWKNLVSLSFEKLTIVTRGANGREKKHQFASGYEMISFYENNLFGFRIYSGLSVPSR